MFPKNQTRIHPKELSVSVPVFLPTCVSTCLSLYVSVSLPVCLSTCLSLYRSVSTCPCLSLSVSTRLSLFPSASVL